MHVILEDKKKDWVALIRSAYLEAMQRDMLHWMAPYESYIRAYLSHWLQAISIKALEHGLERVFTNAPRTCLCFFPGLLVVLVLRANLQLPEVSYRFVPWKQRIHKITDYANWSWECKLCHPYKQWFPDVVYLWLYCSMNIPKFHCLWGSFFFLKIVQVHFSSNLGWLCSISTSYAHRREFVE